MTATDLPVAIAYQFAVIQQARGQPGVGLTLHLLLHGSSGESTVFLQLEPALVWKVRDACAGLAALHADHYQNFLAKRRASHQLNYGDKFLKTLPAKDAYRLFHRRQGELAVPLTFRTTLQRENMGILVESTPTSLGLILRFSRMPPADLVCRLPHDLAFLLADSIDEAIWAAEWERGGLADAPGH
ncbi:hypothetical protein [Noviherbaspirillum soli]|uniref:hypothetical protein n=1 Tax=Noviherbaspirillum soli TaxID=1064518 RepID=UPI00188AD7C6|nr:hypothetical protein [Noviherbaspirillum soli]